MLWRVCGGRSVTRCGSLAPVLNTIALPCLTYDSIICIIMYLLSCGKKQTVAQPCKMPWRVGNPTIAQPWKMLWRHMLAGPPHLHQHSYDSVVYLICLTACKETRQSAQTWKLPRFIANKHGSESVGGSAGAGRCLGAGSDHPRPAMFET